MSEENIQRPQVAAGGHDLQSRLTELEVKLSFAEDLLETLDRTVYRQQQQIERLQAEVKELREQLAAAPEERRSLRDELPPHY